MANAAAAKLTCSQFGSCCTPQIILHGQNTCCDSNRSIHEGVSSHSVCPCQLERVLNRVPSVPVSLLPRPTFNDGTFSIGTDLSAFYSPLARPCDAKEALQVWRDSWYLAQAAAARHSFDIGGFDPHAAQTCARFTERFSPIDLAAAGARRKNATRETTSTLKAWLYEHRKNPYPTKGEKIMLAIITKMTLTQVSTWFANARRRLKKENKMTWSPRNRCGDKKENGEGSGSEGESEDDEELDHKGLDELDMKELKTEDDEKENESKTERRHGEQHGAGIEKRPQATQMAGKKWSGLELTAVCGPTPPTAEDSPVKSLRKWVDGCFHQRQTVLTDSPAVAHPDTPPSTPPHRQPTAEAAVITFARRTSSPNSVKVDQSAHPDKQTSKTEEVFHTRPIDRRSPEVADHREIDAALALTTLSSR